MRHTRVSNGANSSSTLLGLAPGGVCRASFVAKAAVRSYRTVSPLPDPSCEGHRRFVFCGTFPVLADGGRYPPPCSVEPGLSSPAARLAAEAATRPPARTLSPLRSVPIVRMFGPGDSRFGRGHMDRNDRVGFEGVCHGDAGSVAHRGRALAVLAGSSATMGRAPGLLLFRFRLSCPWPVLKPPLFLSAFRPRLDLEHRPARVRPARRPG